MKMLNKKVNLTDVYIYLLSFIIICIITSRYFPIEPDVANSPIVWRELSEHGFSAFKNWRPTIDNWYFTVYPFNFLLFFIFDDDGKVPLILATALFSFTIAVTAHSIARKITGKSDCYTYLLIAALSFTPMFTNTFGFASHPFSHNSTNMFGMLCVLISLNGICLEKKHLTITSGMLSTIASISDPWFLASYFIPIAIAYAIASFRNKNIILQACIYFTFLAIAMSKIIPLTLGLPVHSFDIIPIELWASNAYWTVLIIGRSLNLFFIESDIAYTASFMIWASVFVYSSIHCYNDGKLKRFLAVFATMSLCGIISSYIISYNGPSFISGRFFLNVTCVTLLMISVIGSMRIKKIAGVLIIIFIFSSIYSYSLRDKPLHDEEKTARDYINFLKRNDLSFGYGSFWRNANTVTWLSSGDIHVTPIFFNNNDGTVDFNRSRIQTSDLWRTDKFRSAAPTRQFVSIIEYGSIDGCHNKELCIAGVSRQIGEPDEILHHGEYTILVYNKKIVE